MKTTSANRVFITGASSGIGEALARHYASRGAVIGLVARRGETLSQLAADLGDGVAVGYALDVRNAAALAAAAADFVARHGCPDIVIANAGVSLGTLTEHAEDIQPFQDVMDINVLGMVKTFQPFIAPMRRARRGTLVGIASVAGYRGLPGASAYSASKAAAISYLESLRVELKRSGIRVVTICPGYIATPMTEKNPYPMPFIMSAETAARKMAATIDRGAALAVIPWQMALAARLLHVMPKWLYDLLFVSAPHKPRRPGTR
jgi:short-subunit dehydrogenase